MCIFIERNINVKLGMTGMSLCHDDNAEGKLACRARFARRENLNGREPMVCSDSSTEKKSPGMLKRKESSAEACAVLQAPAP